MNDVGKYMPHAEGYKRVRVLLGPAAGLADSSYPSWWYRSPWWRQAGSSCSDISRPKPFKFLYNAVHLDTTPPPYANRAKLFLRSAHVPSECCYFSILRLSPCSASSNQSWVGSCFFIPGSVLLRLLVCEERCCSVKPW